MLVLTKNREQGQKTPHPLDSPARILLIGIYREVQRVWAALRRRSFLVLNLTRPNVTVVLNVSQP